MSRNRSKSKLLTFAGLISAVTLLLCLSAILIVQTSWFREKVRQRILSAVEAATGGRVELGQFDFDWPRLTATFHDFTVHGTEPASAPPLFRARTVQVKLRILSVFERKVEVSSVLIDLPYIYILVREDGSTNIPSPDLRQKSTERTIADLLNLKLRHFEIRHGIVRTGLQEIPLDLRGDDTALLLTYNRRGPSYLAKVNSRQFYVDSGSLNPVAMTMSAQAHLEKNQLTLDSSQFTSGDSLVRAAGSLKQFNHPVLDLQLNADFSTHDVAPLVRLVALRGGRVRFTGSLHRYLSNPFTLTGKLTTQQLNVDFGAYQLSNCDLVAALAVSDAGIHLSQAKLNVPWGHLTGDATLNRNGEFSVTSRVGDIKVTSAEEFLFHQQVPWQGIAAGVLNFSGIAKDQVSNFKVDTKLDIAPATQGLPVSGHVEAIYLQADNTLHLADSQIALAHTRLAVSGQLNEALQATLDTTDLNELQPLQQLVQQQYPLERYVRLLANGSAHFDGTVSGALDRPHVAGNFLLNNVSVIGETWSRVQTYADLSSESATLTGLSVDQADLHVSGNAHLQLANWTFNRSAPLSLRLLFRGVDIAKLKTIAEFDLPGLSGGIASGSLNLQGRLDDPQGTAQLSIRNLRALNQQIDQASADLQILPTEIRIARGRLQFGPASMTYSGAFAHAPGDLQKGLLQVKADSNAFPLSAIALVRQYEPRLNGQLELHGDAGININHGQVQPNVANGQIVLRHVTQDNVALGDITLKAATKGDYLNAGFSGDLRESKLNGTAQVHLVSGTPVKGELQVDRISLRTLYSFLGTGSSALPFDGFARGSATFEGPLQQPEKIAGNIRVEDLEVSASNLVPAAAGSNSSPQDLVFRNSSPILFDASNGRLLVRSFQLRGRDTNFSLTGSVAYLHQFALNLKADGSLDLRFFELFQPNVRCSGRSLVSASITGSPSEPAVNGTLEIRNGSLFAEGFPNGLTGVNGTLRFDRQRASIEKLLANTGGGTVTVGGFIDLSNAGLLVYRLEASADEVRVRYANSISVTISSELHLSGTSKNSILSGTATVSRVVFTRNADVGTLLAAAAAPTPTAGKENDFITGLQLDIRFESAPDLQVTTELSRDVQAEIDLRLRGTPQQPVLLGDIVANQGDIKVFGGKYSINRGEIRFVNAARIEPVLDLDLQTQARGITVDITISGKLGKLNINYRSDPPLQPRDIIALLTVGRAPDTAAATPNVQNTSETSALQYGANSVLDQAISPVSNRLSKLFGITNIKIDPTVQGITNAAQARVTLEQQISREITVTYVTNLSQTSEQIFRVEWSFSPQYSLVALRDDNGEFGIDIQYKKRFK